MALMVVTHEMGFAREVAHRVLFMDHGRVLERATPDEFFNRPQHPRARPEQPGCFQIPHIHACFSRFPMRCPLPTLAVNSSPRAAEAPRCRMTITMSLFSLLEASRARWRTGAPHQQMVVVRMKRDSLAATGVDGQGIDFLLGRLQRVAADFPTTTYDGQEAAGEDVRLYFFSDTAQPLARSLALALSEVSGCRGAVVRVCSDIGASLGEYAVQGPSIERRDACASRTGGSGDDLKPAPR
jgi:hypothetical protein